LSFLNTNNTRSYPLAHFKIATIKKKEIIIIKQKNEKQTQAFSSTSLMTHMTQLTTDKTR
jgi:hypothetical protein